MADGTSWKVMRGGGGGGGREMGETEGRGGGRGGERETDRGMEASGD